MKTPLLLLATAAPLLATAVLLVATCAPPPVATSAPLVATSAPLPLGATSAPLAAQVSYERILDAASEPGSWLTYSGSYGAQRYSTLDQIDRDNVHRLQPAWVYQTRSTLKFEVSPLVAYCVM